MKKLILLVVILATLVGCSKSDDNNQGPDSPYKNSLIGTWVATNYNDVILNSNPLLYTTLNVITFEANGSYLGTGLFGDDSGTYTLSGNRVKTYVDGKLYTTYEITSLKDDIVEAKMTNSSRSANIKAKKFK